MPKRKRDNEGRVGRRPYNHAERLENERQDVGEKVVQFKKMLMRALKLGRGFERQKLGRRSKQAKDRGEAGSQEYTRIQAEIRVLKTLELSRAAEIHLCKTILKSKRASESELMPTSVRETNLSWDVLEDDRQAINNVTARLFNSKPVKDAMTQIVTEFYIVLRIPPATLEVTKKLRNRSESNSNARMPDKIAEGKDASDTHRVPMEDEEEGISPQTNEISVDGSDWAGLDSDFDSEPANDAIPSDEELSKYDHLIGSSSDDDLSDNSHSLPQPNGSEIDVLTKTSSSPNTTRKRESRPPERKTATATPKSSSFLPTLMGGYWSGSDSDSGEDSSRAASMTAAPRKNRKGQQARRAIWEKKFGDKANHVKSQPAGKNRDAGWDPKRGARSEAENTRGSRRHGAGENRASRREGVGASRAQVTGENMTPLGEKRVGGKRDDTGSLHPSWEAAKKAKELKKMATFQGKKMVFD